MNMQNFGAPWAEQIFELIGIDKGEDSQINGIEQIFTKIIYENFLQLWKDRNIQNIK